MKQKLLFIFFLGFTLAANGQMLQIDTEIDSLQSSIFKTAQNNASEIIINNKLTFLYLKRGHINEAVKVNQKVLQSQFRSQISDTIEFLKAIDYKGDILFFLSDIEEALKVWNISLKLKKAWLPNKPCFQAESYCKIAKYYNFIISVDSALNYSRKAIQLTKALSVSDWNSIDIPEIYRTYIYAYKIKTYTLDYEQYGEHVIEKLDSAILIEHPLTKYYLHVFVHDKANLNTDLALLNQKINPTKKQEYYRKAEYFYNQEKELLLASNPNPMLLSTLYFTKALVTDYSLNHTDDIITKCLNYTDTSIQYLENIDSHDEKTYLFSQSNILQVRQFKNKYLHFLYQKSFSIALLEQMYRNALKSYTTFKKLIAKLKTQHVGTIFQVYNLFQFDALIYAEIELFKRTQNRKYLTDAFYHSQLSKNIDLIKIKSSIIHIDEFNDSKMRSLINENIKATTNSQEVIVDYYSSKFNPLLILIVSDGEVSYIEQNKLQLEEFKLMKHLSSMNDSVYIDLNAHYNILAKPIEKFLHGKNTIHITGNGPFAQLPYDAFLPNSSNKNHFWGDDFTIQHRFSIFINPIFKKNITETDANLSIISPNYKKNRHLLFNKRLCENIENRYKSTDPNRIDHEGFSQNFVLHISAHGYFDSARMKPTLLINDSTLLPADFVSTFKNPPVLACLIMCESAQGEIKTYEGSQNMAREFAMIGTPASISSLWKVDDKASALIMQNFYDYLDQGFPTQEALQKAKIQFRSEHPEMAHPFYWASLQCKGDNISIRLKQKTNYFIVAFSILASFFAIFAGIVFARKIRKKKSFTTQD